MSLFQTGSRVQTRHDIGVVTRPLASGWAYRVTFPGIGEVVCLASVLKAAPLNVIPFTRKANTTEDRRV